MDGRYSCNFRIIQLRADLENLDGAIRIFDPTIAPQKIRPIHRRKPTSFFARGAASRAILDALRRADAPMTAREIAAQLAACHQLDVSTTQSMNKLVAKVRNTVVRHRDGALMSEKAGDRVV